MSQMRPSGLIGAKSCRLARTRRSARVLLAGTTKWNRIADRLRTHCLIKSFRMLQYEYGIRTSFHWCVAIQAGQPLPPPPPNAHAQNIIVMFSFRFIVSVEYTDTRRVSLTYIQSARCGPATNCDRTVYSSSVMRRNPHTIKNCAGERVYVCV